MEYKSLSAGGRQVLGWLRSRGGADGVSWWGQARMSEDLRIARRTLSRYLLELRLAGWLQVTRRGPRSNLYRLSTGCGNPEESGHSFGHSLQLHLFNEMDLETMQDITATSTEENATAGPAPLERKPPMQETGVLRKHVQSTRMASGKVPGESELIAAREAAEELGLTEYQAAAAIERASRAAARKETTLPRSPGWFRQVIRNHAAEIRRRAG